MKYKEESSDLKLEIGKLLADLEQCQEAIKVSEREKADLVTSKLSLEQEIKVMIMIYYSHVLNLLNLFYV